MTNCRSQEMYQKTFADVTFCGFWYIFVDIYCFLGEKRYFLEWIADGKIKAMRLAEARNIEVATL